MSKYKHVLTGDEISSSDYYDLPSSEQSEYMEVPDNSFVNSAIIGGITNSAILGGMLGGDLLGGIVGDLFNGGSLDD